MKALLLLPLLSSPSYGKVVTYDVGGEVDKYISMATSLEKSGEVVVISGTCLSACTLLLASSTTCVTKDSVLGFHGPSTRVGLPLPKTIYDRTVRMMASQYPPALAEWFLKGPAKTTDIHYLSGEQAAFYGVTICEEKRG